MNLSVWSTYVLRVSHGLIVALPMVMAVRCSPASGDGGASQVKSETPPDGPVMGGEGPRDMKCNAIVKRLEGRKNPDGTTGAIRLTFVPYDTQANIGVRMSGVINVSPSDLATLPPDNVPIPCEALPQNLQMADPLYGVQTPITCPPGTVAPETQCTPSGPTVPLTRQTSGIP